MTEFILTEGSRLDIDTLINLTSYALKSFGIWKLLWNDVSVKDEHSWLKNVFAARYTMNDISLFIIKEKVTGKIVGFTAFQWPWDLKPISEEEKKIATSNDPDQIPTPPKGFRIEAWNEIFEMLTGSIKYGYNPQTDFHRKGTMILPEFQNQGLASWLTRFCNDIADHAGRRTFLSARASSLPRLRGLNFEVVGPKEAKVQVDGAMEGAEFPKIWFGVRNPEGSRD